MDQKKKISAALAAVTYYLQEEEAMLMQQAAMGGMPQIPTVSAPTAAFSPWSCSAGPSVRSPAMVTSAIAT